MNDIAVGCSLSEAAAPPDRAPSTDEKWILRMKKTSVVTVFCVSSLILAACAGTGNSTSGFRNGTTRLRALTPEARLALGTLKLEGTPEAVDAAMATKLLPLWQLLAQLNGSTSAAPQEVSAVLDEIRATMSPDQITAIDKMQLTSADVFAVLQQERQANGTSSTGSAGGSSSTARSGATSSSRQNEGNRSFFFAGGGPGFGGELGGNFTNNGNRSSTTQGQSGSSGNSTQSADAFANTTSIVLVNQVIQLLQGHVKG